MLLSGAPTDEDPNWNREPPSGAFFVASSDFFGALSIFLNMSEAAKDFVGVLETAEGIDAIDGKLKLGALEDELGAVEVALADIKEKAAEAEVV